jgi:mono/diheme cytochrome c family protein
LTWTARAAAAAALLSLAPASTVTARDGIEVFGQTCAVCHFSDSAERKVGPGLGGIYRRERLPVSGDPVTDTRITRQIRQGSGAMPPHPYLSGDDVAALLRYLRTL